MESSHPEDWKKAKDIAFFTRNDQLLRSIMLSLSKENLGGDVVYKPGILTWAVADAWNPRSLMTYAQLRVIYTRQFLSFSFGAKAHQ